MTSLGRATFGLALSAVVLAACDGVFGIHVLDDAVSDGGDDGPTAGADAVGTTASSDGDADAPWDDDSAPRSDAKDDDSPAGNASGGAMGDAADTAYPDDVGSAADTTVADAGADTAYADSPVDRATTTPDSAATSADAASDQQASAGDASDGGNAAADSPNADGACEGSSCGGTCVTPGETNLLANGGFDSNVSAWTVFDPNIVLTESALDATGCASSGSVLAKNQAPNGLNSGFYQCAPVTAGATYNAGVQIRTPSGGARGQTFLTVAWFPTSDCTGSSLTLAGQVQSSGTFDVWESLTMTNLVAPSGTGSAYAYGQIIKNLPDSLPYQTYFDMFYLSLAPGGF
jgi:hypothetical protein